MRQSEQNTSSQHSQLAVVFGSPLHAASSAGNAAEVARLLSEGAAEVDSRDINGRTPLHIAACGSKEAVARLLLDRGADINACNDWGDSPLHWAASMGHLSMARLLLKAGANPGQLNKARAMTNRPASPWFRSSCSASLNFTAFRGQ